MADLAVFYEHPQWFAPLFRTLRARGLAYVETAIQDHAFDPAGSPPPAPVVLNRLAMSSFLRQDEHALFYSLAVLDHWERQGARVVNGPRPLAYDLSKARQLSLFRGFGLEIPPTRVAHRREDLARLAAEIGYPVLVKANIGGSGAGIVRYDDAEALTAAARERTTPASVDGVLLVQGLVPAREGRVVRCEFLGGKLLYAIALTGTGGTFDLCPADVCLIDKPQIHIEAHVPPAALAERLEEMVRAIGLDVGGVEYMVDDRDGTPRFYDLNALSNFVADPERILGFDPHEPFVDWLEALVRRGRAAA